MKLQQRANKFRRAAIQLAKANGGYHYGGSFSCAELLTCLYDSVLLREDKFILSKGHGCWVYYAILQDLGFSPRLEGHPHRDPTNGIHTTTGSMGHGFPVGVGIALGMRRKGVEGRCFVLVGDGECQEGTTWEAMLLAGHLNLRNLAVIVDNNRLQGSGVTTEILPTIEPLKSVAKSAGWFVREVDGHSDEIIRVLHDNKSRPTLVIAHTVKGKGVSFMENQPGWHAQALTPELEEQALRELR